MTTTIRIKAPPRNCSRLHHHQHHHHHHCHHHRHGLLSSLLVLAVALCLSVLPAHCVPARLVRDTHMSSSPGSSTSSSSSSSSTSSRSVIGDGSSAVSTAESGAVAVADAVSAADAGVTVHATPAPVLGAEPIHEYVPPCEERALECVGLCNPNDPDCLSQCASSAAVRYWKSLPRTLPPIIAHCAKYCESFYSTDQKNCNAICYKGFTDHFFVSAGLDRQLYCNATKDGDHYRTPYPADPPTKCVDVCQDHCDKTFPGQTSTLDMASCQNICTHNTAGGYFLQAGRPAVVAMRRQCGTDEACFNFFANRFFPSIAQCNMMNVRIPSGLKDPQCANYCTAFYYIPSSPEWIIKSKRWADLCTWECVKSFTKYRHTGSRLVCKDICDAGKVWEAGTDEEASNNGCWQGCLNPTIDRWD